jgi:hypothetical protein
LFPQAKSAEKSSRKNLMQAGRPLADTIGAGMSAAGFPQLLGMVVRSNNSYGAAVILEQASEPLTTCNGVAGPSEFIASTREE